MTYARKLRTEKRGKKRLVQDIVEADVPEAPKRTHMDEDGPVLSTEDLQHQLQDLTKERAALISEKEDWEKERNALLGQVQTAAASALDSVRSVLCSFFSPFQVDFILTGKPIKHWNEDDIGRALTLRSLSPKAYRYLREKCKFPFSSVSDSESLDVKGAS